MTTQAQAYAKHMQSTQNLDEDRSYFDYTQVATEQFGGEIRDIETVFQFADGSIAMLVFDHERGIYISYEKQAVTPTRPS